MQETIKVNRHNDDPEQQEKNVMDRYLFLPCDELRMPDGRSFAEFVGAEPFEDGTSALIAVKQNDHSPWTKQYSNANLVVDGNGLWFCYVVNNSQDKITYHFQTESKAHSIRLLYSIKYLDLIVIQHHWNQINI